jgi:flavin-dependent dehydrogenase
MNALTLSSKLHTEVCVVGGGPAGSVIACFLAQHGHDVLMVDGGRAAKSHRTESLSPSLRAMLGSLGLQSCMDAATFCREDRALVCWDEDSILLDRSYRTPRLLIDRMRFDQFLRGAASSAGVRILATRSYAPYRHPVGGWSIPLCSANGSRSIRADFFVDARGKRRGGLDDGSHKAPRTAAMTASWCLGSNGYAETRIEAGTNEWFWGSPLLAGSYAATIFLDPKRIAGLTKDERMGLYLHLLMDSKLLRDLFSGGLIGPVKTCDATSRFADDLIGEDFVRVGEAAFSIDPLSSQGVQAAIRSGIQGAVAVHTILARPADRDAALEFYRERQRKAASQCRMNTAQHYWRRARSSDNPFWRRRALEARIPATRRDAQSGRPVSSYTCLRVSPALRIVEVPVLSDEFIKRAAVLTHPALEDPVGYLDGVPLEPLIREVETRSSRDFILHRWSMHVGPAKAGKILNWMCEFGILLEEDSVCYDAPLS